MIGYIIGIIFGSITMLIALVLFIIKYFKNRSIRKVIKRIGTSAEEKINSDIGAWARHTKNKFMPSTLFKYSTNKVFEVDSILVTDKALIVIEIKSIKGGVEGSGIGLKWEKVLGDKRFFITNPITQNDKHIEHIVKMTKMKVPIISLIIFSNRVSYLKVDDIPSHALVIKESDLFDSLDSINSNLQTSMNETQVKDLYLSIKNFKAKKSKDFRLHKKITRNGAQPWK